MDSPSSPTDFEDSRKRVCKACDRCRIKKSKCDGKKPCSRCRNDDAICVFGGRKKKIDRVHPKGYVEILERQQRQLVKGIRALFDLQISQGRSWDGPLPRKGYPPTHEILEYLGALEVDDSSEDEDNDESSHFEENIQQLRHSVVRKADGYRSENPRSQASLLQSQRPGDYVGRLCLGSISEADSAPSLSPALSPSDASPSTSSIDSQRWLASQWPVKTLHQQGTSTSNIFIPTGDMDPCVDCDFDISPVQIGFSDPCLVPEWEPDKDLGEHSYIDYES